LPESLLELPDPGGECLLVGVVLLFALSLNISQTRIYTVKKKLAFSRPLLGCHYPNYNNNNIIPARESLGKGKSVNFFLQCLPLLRVDIFFVNIAIISFYCMYKLNIPGSFYFSLYKI
jgi:hypothetical protein